MVAHRAFISIEKTDINNFVARRAFISIKNIPTKIAIIFNLLSFLLKFIRNPQLYISPK